MIARCAPVFDGLPREVEVCNQARVPIWFSKAYGVDRQPIVSTEAAVREFASKSHCAAMRLDGSGRPELIAPFGLSELYSLHVRPVPGVANPAGWNKECAAQKVLWPEIKFDLVAL